MRVGTFFESVLCHLGDADLVHSMIFRHKATVPLPSDGQQRDGVSSEYSKVFMEEQLEVVEVWGRQGRPHVE